MKLKIHSPYIEVQLVKTVFVSFFIISLFWNLECMKLFSAFSTSNLPNSVGCAGSGAQGRVRGPCLKSSARPLGMTSWRWIISSTFRLAKGQVPAHSMSYAEQGRWGIWLGCCRKPGIYLVPGPTRRHEDYQEMAAFMKSQDSNTYIATRFHRYGTEVMGREPAGRSLHSEPRMRQI